MIQSKTLIEVALPLEAINDASAYDKMPGIGPHPKGIHHWWARLPLPAARAILFASLISDPSDDPRFKQKSETEQNAERERLFGILRQMLQKKIYDHPQALTDAHAEIVAHCDGRLPPVLDPFCGGGSIPLEAQRLGLRAKGGDLNPVAVLISKAIVDIIPRFANAVPVHPEARRSLAHSGEWTRGKGLAEDVRRYGMDILKEAQARIRHLYPKGPKHEIILAWIWARVVKCPNPACGALMPLVRSFVLSNKKDKQTWIEPVVRGNQYSFSIKTGAGKPRAGTITRRGAICICCDTPVPLEYIRVEGKGGRLGSTLLAMVAEGIRGKTYLPPEMNQITVARSACPTWRPDTELPKQALGFRVQAYGMSRHSDLFTSRQLVALETLSRLVSEARTRILDDAASLGDGDASAYADAVVTFLATSIDRCADFNNALCRWSSSNEKIMNLFGRQVIPMVWDYSEANILEATVGGWSTCKEYVADCVAITSLGGATPGTIDQTDAAQAVERGDNLLVSTDPPYYNNIGYADLSDFFYVWLRRTLSAVYPDLFSTLLVPKAAELIAEPFRFDGNREEAKKHFETGFKRTFTLMKEKLDPRFPMTVYYAFKQTDDADADDDEEYDGLSQMTGWETLLESLISSGFQITATWPVRASQQWRMRSMGSNALASYIILACRPRASSAPLSTRREFMAQLKLELPVAIRRLQQASIQAVDLAQAAIGPGIAVYSRFGSVLDATGEPLSVRAALMAINQMLGEVLIEQEGDFDAETRWALAWFEQAGFQDGSFGDALVLANAKNTTVDRLVDAGIVFADRGKVRLYKPEELSMEVTPKKGSSPAVWAIVHHLIRVLESVGEVDAAALLNSLGAQADTARELCYHLFALCERKKRAVEAKSYNGLVQSWPEIIRLSRETQGLSKPAVSDLFS